MNLLDVVKTPDELRDAAWENSFFKSLTEGKITLLSPEPISGPDGWPYLLAETTEKSEEPTQQVLQWLSTRGIGLVINPQREYPDYVFTFGMIWSFRETGFFYRQNPAKKDGTTEFSSASIAHAGTLSKSYLPDYARSILKEFFRDQGLLEPRVLLVSSDRLNYDLAISLESLGNPPANEHAGIAEAISWFLPPHYSLLLVSEQGLPNFAPL
jgi:hypothetical protein